MPAPSERGRGRRLALIIAESTYNDPMLQQLRAPGTDASELAEVLRDPDIGRFEVDTLIDEPADQVKRHIYQFCEQARPGDLLLMYLSCHGVLDDRGRLYYAAKDTERGLLDVTSVPAEWLNDKLKDSRSREEILILDCCHSGAFARGAKGEEALALQDKFTGRGTAVLTASRATEYSFEGDTVVGDDVRSIFTRTVVEGLRSGAADHDKDGLVSVDDLYRYVYDQVREAEPRQTPERWVSNGEGDLVVATSVRGAVIEPVPLPEDLALTLDSPRMVMRETAVRVLAELLAKGAPGLALTAREKLQQICEEDHPKIAAQAREALEHQPPAMEAVTSAASETSRPPAPHPPGAEAAVPSSLPDQEVAALVTDPDYVAALDAYFAGRWDEAVELWTSLSSRYPDDPDAAAKLADARNNKDLSAWYEKADLAGQRGDWGEVVAALSRVVGINESYRDANARLQFAREQKKRQGLQADLRTLSEAQKWSAVVAAGRQYAALVPDDPDPDGLVAQASAHLMEADLADRYASGLRQMGGGDWQGARDTFAAIDREQPGYQNVTALLSRADQNLSQIGVTADRDSAAAWPPPAPPPGIQPVPQSRQPDVKPVRSARLSSYLTPRNIVIGLGAVLLLALLVSVPLLRDQGGTQVAPPKGTRVVGTVNVGGDPEGLVVVNANGPKVFVANYSDGTVSVIDARTRKVVRTVEVGGYPLGVAAGTSGQAVYVANSTDDNLSVIEPQTGAVTGPIKTGDSPDSLAAAGSLVYATNFSSGTVSAIDTSTNMVSNTIRVGRDPMGIAADTSRNAVYVTNFSDDTVSLIDTRTAKAIARIKLAEYGGPKGVAVNPSTHVVYVANYLEDSVSVIDGRTRKITNTIQVGAGPDALAVDPAIHRLYVVNHKSGTLSVIDTRSNKVTATISVGRQTTGKGANDNPGEPQGVAVDTSSHAVFVSNRVDHTVTVLQTN